MLHTKQPLLSITIPAWNRPEHLRIALKSLLEQIVPSYQDCIEVLICDDASPNPLYPAIQDLVEAYDFVKFHRNQSNVGLQKNLIECTHQVKGRYLWIFGDDDFLAADHALRTIMNHLQRREIAVLILNKKRCDKAGNVIMDNYLGIESDKIYPTLAAFCHEYGLYGVLGFVTSVIFERNPFMMVEAEPYEGTMYPQLGKLIEAHASAPAYLVGDPLICHRTLTVEDRLDFYQDKEEEKAFFTSSQQRLGRFYGFAAVKMLNRFLKLGIFTPQELDRMPELLTSRKRLTPLVASGVYEAHQLGLEISLRAHNRAVSFFNQLTLDDQMRDCLDWLYQTTD